MDGYGEILKEVMMIWETWVFGGGASQIPHTDTWGCNDILIDNTW